MYADAILDSFVCRNLQEKTKILLLVLKVLKHNFSGEVNRSKNGNFFLLLLMPSGGTVCFQRSLVVMGDTVGNVVF